MHPRRGLTLFELIVALFVMTTAMTAIVKLLAVAASQRRAVEERRVALAEVANQAERIALQSWEETPPKESETFEVSDALRRRLPLATATKEVHEETEPVRARRIRLLVQSPNSVGQTIDLADLTIWKFAPGGEP